MALQKIDEQIKNIILNACDTANALGINEFSLEHNNKGVMIRGFTGDHGSPVMINHVFDQLTLPFQSFAINNCKTFGARFGLATSMDPTCNVSINIDDRDKTVKYIQFTNTNKDKKFNLKFNVGNADSVKAPKGITDKVAFTFSINESIVDEMKKAIRAMAGTDITLIYDGSNLSYEIRTGNNDTDTFSSSIEIADTNDNTSWVYTYPFSVLLPILTKKDNNTLHITSRGLLTCAMNNLTIYLLPRIQRKHA